MGQKIHPTGLRLGITQEHQSCWFADPKRYSSVLQEDHRIRAYIEKNLSNAGISCIRIDRKAEQLELEIRTARPGVVVGRGGKGIEDLRIGIQRYLGNLDRPVRINVVEVERVDADAVLAAEYIAQQLERRVSFRRVVRQAMQRAERAGVKGMKVQVSGRLNGAEIARTSGHGKVVFPSTPSGPILTMPTALPKPPTGCWVLKCGFSKGKSFPVKWKPPKIQATNPVVGSLVAVNGLKIAQTRSNDRC